MSKGKQEEFTPAADAGIRITAGTLDLKKEADAKGFIARSNPFALFPLERSYENSQRAANLISMSGGWTDMDPDYKEKEEPGVDQGLAPIEPQPDRRLAGILIGETVTALLDMGDGRIQTVRPGQLIEPDKEWRVLSIDEDTLILQRTNNRHRPALVAVRLGQSLSGGSGGGATGGATGGGAPNGGAPGDGPGGDQRDQ